MMARNYKMSMGALGTFAELNDTVLKNKTNKRN